MNIIRTKITLILKSGIKPCTFLSGKGRITLHGDTAFFRSVRDILCETTT